MDELHVYPNGNPVLLGSNGVIEWEPGTIIGHAPEPRWKRRLRRYRFLQRFVPPPPARPALPSDVPLGIWTGDSLLIQGMVSAPAKKRLTRWQRLRRWLRRESE